MFSPSDAWRKALAGLRRSRPAGGRGAVALALLVAGAGTLAAMRGRGGGLAEPIVLKHEDLVLTAEVEGELAAVRSTEIGVAPVAEVDFKIAFLAPEGATVKKGDLVLGLDTEVLDRQLVEKKAELEESEKKVEQKQVDLRLKLLDLDQQTAQAEADLGRASLKADMSPEVQQRLELAKARLDKRGRERDLENLQAERRSTEGAGDAELRSLRSQRDRARGRVAALQTAIAKMAIKAPQDGIVVYRSNWRDEKKKVGDSVWFGETVLALPDLSEMKADGFVDEADGGTVAEGQPVTLRLEARPELDLHGRVKTLGRSVRQRSWRTPLKVFKVEIGLDGTDPTVMRPAMRFRGEIETGRVPGRLLAPRDAVFLRETGPVVWARRALGWKEVPVRLGRSNRRLVEVVSGLAEGDRVSPIDLALADSATPRRPSRGAP